MRKTLTLTALLTAGLLAGSAVHAAPAPPAPQWWKPGGMHQLKLDLRAVLHHAGFTLSAAVGGEPPASVHYIKSFNRLMFSARAGRRLEWQVGTDPLRDYLTTELSRWGATRTGDRWVWRSAGGSVTLIYQPAGPRAGRAALLHPEAELIIVHYTPPAPPSGRWR